MADRPIIMTAESVRAILDGRKTQTRRVVSRTNSTADGHRADAEVWRRLRLDEAAVSGDGEHLSVMFARRGAHHTFQTWARVRSVIREGDRLWVKERWALGRGYDGEPPSSAPDFARVWYADTGLMEHTDTRGTPVRGQWRSPRFMPRWASRLTLTVTDVRAQRLQDIAEADATAEGCMAQPAGRVLVPAVSSFRRRWDAINAKRGFPWDSNPWVWVVEFRGEASDE